LVAFGELRQVVVDVAGTTWRRRRVHSVHLILLPDCPVRWLDYVCEGQGVFLSILAATGWSFAQL